MENRFSFNLSTSTANKLSTTSVTAMPSPDAEKRPCSEIYLPPKGFESIALSSNPVPYAALSEADIYSMSIRQANLSKAYAHGELNSTSECRVIISGSGAPRDGRSVIAQVMSHLDYTMTGTDCFVNLQSTCPESLQDFHDAFRAHLEDPGFLAFATYYGVASDPDFLCFLYDLWEQNGRHARSFLTSKVWFPNGECKNIDLDSAWGRFCSIEGMSLTDLETQVRWGNALALEFSDMDFDPANQANRSVSLLGLSLSHPVDTVKSLMLSGARVLGPGGIMAFDLPIKNQSLRRMTRTVGYPTYPGFRPYPNSSKAMEAALGLVRATNSALKRDAFESEGNPEPGRIGYLDILETRLIAFLPWGETSLLMILRKYEV